MSDSVSLAFHRSLYLPEAVHAAAEAYGGYATIRVTDSPTDLVVELSGYDTRYGETIIDSFNNHVLFESVVRSRETLGGVPI